MCLGLPTWLPNEPSHPKYNFCKSTSTLDWQTDALSLIVVIVTNSKHLTRCSEDERRLNLRRKQQASGEVF